MPFMPDHPPTTLVGQLARRLLGPIPAPVTTTIGPNAIGLGPVKDLKYYTRAIRAALPEILKSGELPQDVLHSVEPSLKNVMLNNGNVLPNIDVAADPTGYISTLRHLSGPFWDEAKVQASPIKKVVDDLSSYFTSPKYDPFVK